ncbi:MAG: hypothetical protein RSA12_09330 [Clostridia bacterium]
MIEQLGAWVRKLFGKKPRQQAEAGRARAQAQKYEDASKINFTAIFAGKLASIAMSDSTLDISDAAGGESRRSAFIASALRDIWERSGTITAQALGKGGKVIVPYIAGGKARFGVADQDRLFISRMDGARPISATLLADRAKVDGRDYYRWTDYTLEDGVHTIKNRASTDAGRQVPLALVPEWANVTEEMRIAGVDRLLLAFVRCPADTRRDGDFYGVPITYGCEALIGEVEAHLKLIAREYKLTRPMLGLDSRLWQTPFGSGGPNANIQDIERTVQDGDTPFIPLYNCTDEEQMWLHFAPAIRDGAMYRRLEELFGLLEKSVGVSKGVLTPRESANATATEIRAANHDTYSLATAIRHTWEVALDDLAYAFDVYAECFGLSPAGARGDWAVHVGWDMSLFESSSETFQQMSELESRGMLSKPELRQWVMGGTIDEAIKAVAGIEQPPGPLDAPFAGEDD